MSGERWSRRQSCQRQGQVGLVGLVGLMALVARRTCETQTRCRLSVLLLTFAG